MRRLILSVALLSGSCFAHNVQLLTQHIKLNRQNETAYQMDAIGRFVANDRWDVGLQGTYLDRFDFYENRIGAFATYHTQNGFVIEGRYLKGEEDVVILPHDQYQVSIYQSLAPGLSPYLIYKNSLYSVTHVQSGQLGIEIEKIKSFIITPQVMLGQARFDNPSEVKDVYNYGLKLAYYQEGRYGAAVFANKGTEAAQGIIGESNITTDTTTGGFSLSYYFIPKLLTEFIFDYTDYGDLDNQFLTSTLNLNWAF